MSHVLPEMMMQSTQHEVLLHGLQEMMSERQVISHDPSVISIVVMVQNDSKCITYNC